MELLFSQRFKDLRKEFSFSQQQIADRLHYTQGNVSGWENGTVEPKASALAVIANFFNVSTDYLLGRSDDFGNVSIVPTAPALSAEENKLIKNFRAMRSDLQTYYLEMSETFIQKPENLIKNEKLKMSKKQ